MGAGPRRALDQRRVDNRRLGPFQLEPMRLDLATDLGQQIIVNTTPKQRIAEPAMGGLIRHRRMQIEAAKQHEIQPYLEGSLQLRVAQTVPPPGRFA